MYYILCFVDQSNPKALPGCGFDKELFLVEDGQLSSITCPICLGILNNPYTSQACPDVHTFCEGCIKVWIDRWGICPLDKTKITSVDISPNADKCRQVERSRIRCPSHGCAWQGQLVAFERHVEGSADHDNVSALLRIPAAIVFRGCDAINAYQSALTHGKTMMRTCCLSIVGHETVGKTTLLKRLNGMKFADIVTSTSSTVGIDIAISQTQKGNKA